MIGVFTGVAGAGFETAALFGIGVGVGAKLLTHARFNLRTGAIATLGTLATATAIELAQLDSSAPQEDIAISTKSANIAPPHPVKTLST